MMAKTLHFSPFQKLTGANKSMLTLVGELAQSAPTVVVVACEGELAEAARGLGALVEVAFDKRPSQGRLARWLGFRRAIAKAAKTHGVELIHIHSAMGVRYVWPQGATRHCPVVLHQRDNYQPDYFHLGIGRVDHIIAISDWVKSTLPPKLHDRVTVIHNAVSLGPVVQTPGTAPKVIGMAGRCVADKGIDLLIDAAAHIDPQHDFQVVVWGVDDSDYGLSLKERVKAMGTLGQQIQLHPFRSDMSAFYEQVDMVAVPSRYPEPFGRMAIEAMAAGKPLVVAGHGGLVEIVTHKQTGLHHRPGDAADLGKQLSFLLSQPEEATRLAQRGREEVVGRFSSDEHGRSVTRLYDRLLGRH